MNNFLNGLFTVAAVIGIIWFCITLYGLVFS